MARRANPGDDIVSIVANGEVDGHLLEPVELLSYFFLLVVAGNETTRNAMTGGMLALLENGEGMAQAAARRGTVGPRRRRDRTLDDTGHSVRTYRYGGFSPYAARPSRPGSRYVLFYASGNRDEEIFDNPHDFRVDRDPNPHIGFGMGEHVCLGGASGPSGTKARVFPTSRPPA